MEAQDHSKYCDFLWFLYQGVIFTRDNLARRNWQDSNKTCACGRASSRVVGALLCLLIEMRRALLLLV